MLNYPNWVGVMTSANSVDLFDEETNSKNHSGILSNLWKYTRISNALPKGKFVNGNFVK